MTHRCTGRAGRLLARRRPRRTGRDHSGRRVAPTTTTATAPASSGSTQPSSPLCTPGVFSQAQQSVASALSGRATQLNSLLSAVGDTTSHLTPGDQETLQHDISTVELPGIEGLQTQVQQATTCVELRTEARSMVFDYRVYYVMTPQTHLTIVADDEETFDRGHARESRGYDQLGDPEFPAARQERDGRGRCLRRLEESAQRGAELDQRARTPSCWPRRPRAFPTTGKSFWRHARA